MNKKLAKKIMLSILAGSTLLSSGIACASIPAGWNEVIIGTNPFYDTYYVPSTGDSVAIDSGEYVFDGASTLRLASVATTTGLATKGNITISGSAVVQDVYGGVSNEGNAEKNKVTISGGITEWVLGGESLEGNAINNEVVVNGGTIDGNVFGGRTGSSGGSGSANNNRVVINGGSADWVTGGWAFQGDTSNNEVVVNDGNLERVCGGGGDGDTKNNNVIINGGTVSGSVYGGSGQDDGVSEGNIVNINGGTIKGHVGNSSLYGDSINEKVIVTGGEITGKVYGGFSSRGNTNNNVVTILGGTCKDFVAGGWVNYDGNVLNNVVNIGGTANLANAELFGGVSGYRDVFNIKYGNHTLNIGWDGEKKNIWTGAEAGSVKTLAGFDTINFKGIEWVQDGTIIKANDVSFNPNSSTEITVEEVYNINGKIAKGEQMNLIEAGNVEGDITSGNKSVKVLSGNFLKADDVACDISKENNAIVLTINEDVKYKANDQALLIGESRTAAAAFTNQGSELVETGLDAFARDNARVGDTKVFAALYGNASEYATGSYVKVNGISGIVGVGKTNANGLTVGAFFENGEGNYRTYNTLDGEFMRGDGEANYNGGGFLARKDNANGVYTEASLRAGNLQNELRNAVKGSDGLTGYDVDTFYYGAHIGVGKVIPRGNDGDSIDVYGKFIYTHHDSENFTIDGDDFYFDSVDSERLRLGFRINEVQTNRLSMYYGAVWEYEFGGDANNTVVDYDLETPSLGGSTVIGEVGAHYNASEKWSFDLNARAYVGQREGFSGSVQANYNF